MINNNNITYSMYINRRIYIKYTTKILLLVLVLFYLNLIRAIPHFYKKKSEK